MTKLFSNYSGTYPFFDNISSVLQIKLKPAIYEIIFIVSQTSFVNLVTYKITYTYEYILYMYSIYNLYSLKNGFHADLTEDI